MGNDENYLSSSSNLLDNQLFKENANNSYMSHLTRRKISSQHNESSDDSKSYSQDDDDNNDNNKDEIPTQHSKSGTFMTDLQSKENPIKFDKPDFINENNIRDNRNNYPSSPNTLDYYNDKMNNAIGYKDEKYRAEFFEHPKFTGNNFIPYNNGLRTIAFGCCKLDYYDNYF